MTLKQAKLLKQGDYVHHVTKLNADNTPMRAKVTSIKTWKRSPSKIVVSVKHGMYDYAKFNEYTLNEIALGYGS